MIEAMPSNTRKTDSTSVRDTVPESGRASKMTPAAMATSADRSDHPKPGEERMRNVLTSPTKPLMSSSQPISISTARVAMGGTMMASTPRATRTMPSIRKVRQCRLSEAATAA